MGVRAIFAGGGRGGGGGAVSHFPKKLIQQISLVVPQKSELAKIRFFSGGGGGSVPPAERLFLLGLVDYHSLQSIKYFRSRTIGLNASRG